MCTKFYQNRLGFVKDMTKTCWCFFSDHSVYALKFELMNTWPLCLKCAHKAYLWPQFVNRRKILQLHWVWSWLCRRWWCTSVEVATTTKHYHCWRLQIWIIRNKIKSFPSYMAPRGSTDLRFFITQTDNSLHCECETMNTELVYCTYHQGWPGWVE